MALTWNVLFLFCFFHCDTCSELFWHAHWSSKCCPVKKVLRLSETWLFFSTASQTDINHWYRLFRQGRNFKFWIQCGWIFIFGTFLCLYKCCHWGIDGGCVSTPVMLLAGHLKLTPALRSPVSSKRERERLQTGKRKLCKMDPIVVAPQARGCRLIQESITIWSVLVANCVFLGVCACVCVYSSANCMHVCVWLHVHVQYVLMCFFPDISPWQLLFLVVHMRCDTSWHHHMSNVKLSYELICKLVFRRSSSRLHLKVFPYVGCETQSEYVQLHARVGGWTGSHEMANVNLCTCDQIHTDYHNHIWLWRDFLPALFHASQQTHSPLPPL